MNETQVRIFFEDLMLRGLGLDMEDPNLVGTPDRVARMYCREFFANVGKEFTNFKSFPNDKGYDQIIMADNIDFVSVCSHHFLPFTGKAWILYIPDKKLTGLSKMARVVTHYAARPQIQETLCHDILASFVKNIQPLGAMIFMRAEHACMQCRGAKQANAGMGTSQIWGVFKENPNIKSEGLDLIKISLAR